MLVGTCMFLPVAISGAFVERYAAFLLARAVAGLAAGGLFVLGANVVAEVFAGARQGFVTTVFITSAPVSFAPARLPVRHSELRSGGGHRSPPTP